MKRRLFIYTLSNFSLVNDCYFPTDRLRLFGIHSRIARCPHALHRNTIITSCPYGIVLAASDRRRIIKGHRVTVYGSRLRRVTQQITLAVRSLASSVSITSAGPIMLTFSCWVSTLKLYVAGALTTPISEMTKSFSQDSGIQCQCHGRESGLVHIVVRHIDYEVIGVVQIDIRRATEPILNSLISSIEVLGAARVICCSDRFSRFSELQIEVCRCIGDR